VWGGSRLELENAGHDIVWTGDWEQDPGDDEILNYAYQEKRILVTIDKDFGEMAIIRRLPHSGILRLVNISAKQQAKVTLRAIELYGNELQSGAIVTAEPDRVRVRPPNNPKIEECRKFASIFWTMV
jgi:predicted nuclease of predicted toxin-antitoxin system